MLKRLHVQLVILFVALVLLVLASVGIAAREAMIVASQQEFDDATQAVNYLRVIQIVLLLCALTLLSVLAWMTRHSLMKPLEALGAAAKRIGENRLDEPIQVEGQEELRE